MTREEEKEHQSHLYTKVRCDLVEIPDWEEVEFGFQAGMEYADEHPIHYDGQAMLYVLQKGVKQGKKEMLDKAIEWLRNETMGLLLQPKENYELVQEFVDCFKEAMEDKK